MYIHIYIYIYICICIYPYIHMQMYDICRGAHARHPDEAQPDLGRPRHNRGVIIIL